MADEEPRLVGIERYTETQRVYSLAGSMEPDPNWSALDASGHLHTWERKRFEWVFDGPEFYYDIDGDEHNGMGHYECLDCRSPIWPESIHVPPNQAGDVIVGMTHYYARYSDNRIIEISPEEAEALGEELRNA